MGGKQQVKKPRKEKKRTRATGVPSLKEMERREQEMENETNQDLNNNNNNNDNNKHNNPAEEDFEGTEEYSLSLQHVTPEEVHQVIAELCQSEDPLFREKAYRSLLPFAQERPDFLLLNLLNDNRIGLSALLTDAYNPQNPPSLLMVVMSLICLLSEDETSIPHFLEKGCPSMSVSALFVIHKEKYSANTELKSYVENQFLFLRNLCEAQESAVKVLNQNTEFLGPCLGFLKFPESVAIATAQFLESITEQNTKWSKAISKNNSAIETINSIFANSPNIYLKTLLAGIKFNIVPEKEVGKIARDLVFYLSSVLEKNPFEEFLQMSQHFEDIIVNDVMMSQSVSFTNFSYVIKSQSLAFQILTNMYFGAEIPPSEQNEDPLSFISPEMLQILASAEIVQKILPKISIPEAVFQLVKKYEDALSLDQFWNLQYFAVNCVANFFSLQGFQCDQPEQLWQFFLQLHLQPEMPTQNMESVLRTLINILRSNPSFLPNIEALDTITKIGTSQTSLSVPQIRIFCVKLFGLFGKRIHGEPAIPTIATIGTMLIRALADEIVVASEAVNSIMDIFAETEWNGVVSQLGMIPILNQFNLQLQKVNVNSLSEDERGPIEDTQENLPRFLEYKAQQ